MSAGEEVSPEEFGELRGIVSWNRVGVRVEQGRTRGLEVTICDVQNPGAKMGLRRAPYAFTEQGVAMLSSVLRSERAIAVNIEILRAFVRLRDLLAGHAELARRLAELEKKYDKQFAVVFDAIRQLMAPPKEEKHEIGYHTLIRKQ